jgi:hypothetical protein
VIAWRALRSRLPLALTWPHVAAKLGLAPTSVRRVNRTPLGCELQLHIGPPLSSVRLGLATREIAAAYGVARVRVVEDPLRADLVSLFLDTQLATASLPYPRDTRAVWLPHSLLTPLPIGIDEAGSVVTIPLLGQGALLGGLPGAGKSLGMRVFLAGLSACRELVLIGIDPKRADLVLWKDRMSALVLGHDVEATTELLTTLLDIIHGRATYLASTGRATLPPSDEHPAIVLVVDEWAEVGATGTPKERQQIETLLRRVVSLGRAVGVTVIIATQRPTSDTIDVTTRSLIGHRFALRCGDRHQADAILGIGTYEQSDLVGATPGRALWSDGGRARVVQFFYLNDEEVSEFVCAGLLPRTPWSLQK